MMDSSPDTLCASCGHPRRCHDSIHNLLEAAQYLWCTVLLDVFRGDGVRVGTQRCECEGFVALK